MMLTILIDFALRSTVLLAGVFILAAALRRNSAATRHLLLSLTFIAILLLPLFQIALPAWRILPSLTATQKLTPSAPPTSKSIVAHPLVPAIPIVEAPAVAQISPIGAGATIATHSQKTPETHKFKLLNLIPILYVSGIAFSLLPLFVATLALLRLRGSSKLLHESPWPHRLREAQAALHMQRTITLLQSVHAHIMPMTWGAIRPKILLPAEANRWSANRRQLVLLHELAHIMRHDILIDTLARLACALCWFNPLIWLAARRLRIEAELACDDLVLGATTSGTPFKPSTYAGELLELASTFRRPAFPIAAIAMARANNSQLHSRIYAILDAGRNRRRLTRLAASACVLAALLCAITLAIAQTAAPIPEPIAQWAQSHHFAVGEIYRTTLESPLGGWRNLPFTLSADEETDLKTCIALSHKAFDTVDGQTLFFADSARNTLDGILKKRPNFFYAEYLLSLWHRQHHHDADAAKLLDVSFTHAPVIIVQRFELSTGGPLANSSIRSFALEHNRVQKGYLDPSLELSYPDLRTDAQGCIFLPAYDTVFRCNNMASPAGYSCDYPRLGWFESPQKVSLLPVAVVTPEAGEFDADDSSAVVSTATLPDNNTVELLAVSRYPQQSDKIWWSPDGTPSRFAATAPPSAISPWPNDGGRCFAFRFAKQTSKDVHLQFRFSVPNTAKSHYAAVGPNQVSEPLFVYVAIPTEPARVSIRLGESGDPWTTLTDYDVAANAATPALPDEFAIDPLKVDTNGHTVFLIHHPPNDMEFRFIAIDTDGHEHKPEYSGAGSVNNIAQDSGYFKDLPVSHIKSIRILARSFHWVEFKNIAAKPASAADAFPNPVPFDLGDSHFLPGDKITITEIRGTAPTITPHNTYQIKGTYTLASHDRATLATFVTSESADDTHHDPYNARQSIQIYKGKGTFTVVLPFISKGSPHLSFYPIDGGNSFSDLYFKSKWPEVLILVSPTGLSFEGSTVTWDALPALLEKIPDRPNTLLAFALTTNQMSIADHDNAFSRVGELARKFHFRYASDTGIRPRQAATTPSNR